MRLPGSVKSLFLSLMTSHPPFTTARTAVASHRGPRVPRIPKGLKGLGRLVPAYIITDVNRRAQLTIECLELGDVLLICLRELSILAVFL